MAVSVIDSRIFQNTFGTLAIRELFSDEAYARNLIEVEAALARAESRVGAIPGDAGTAISETLSKVQIDFARLQRDTDNVGYPVLPLIRQLTEQTSPDLAKYIHWGATTQDIMDNAMMLQIRSGIRHIRDELIKLITILGGLAGKYRDTYVSPATHVAVLTHCVDQWLGGLTFSMRYQSPSAINVLSISFHSYNISIV